MVIWSSVGVLLFSMLVMCYQLRVVVMNPVFRPHIINTQARLAVFSIVRLSTTFLSVIGIWYSCGWVAALLTYLEQIIRSIARKHFAMAAIEALTNDLVRWQDDGTIPDLPADTVAERVNIARLAAAETVQGWLKGDS